MLEQVDLSRKLSKEEYKARLPVLQRRLFELQRYCRNDGLGSLIVFQGWDAAGKGTSIRRLTARLEPRGFQVHAIREPRTSEKHLPWLWRFWRTVPNWGDMAIFDRSWYGRVLVERVEGLTPEPEWRRAYDDINTFERTLSDDHYVIVKFFLHISKKTQKRRFRQLERNPATAWEVEDEDWRHHKQYDEYCVAVEDMLTRTDREWAPWTIVAASNQRWAQVHVMETLVQRLEEGLVRRGFTLPDVPGAPSDSKEEDELGD